MNIDNLLFTQSVQSLPDEVFFLTLLDIGKSTIAGNSIKSIKSKYPEYWNSDESFDPLFEHRSFLFKMHNLVKRTYQMVKNGKMWGNQKKGTPKWNTLFHVEH